MRQRQRTRAWMKVAIVSTACVASMTVYGQQTNPRDLFERARLLEDNPRQVARAIELYRQVAEDARHDRALAGQAQLRVGLLLERQGNAEARRVLAGIVRDFADQPTVASAARTRLAGQIAELTPRRLFVDPAFPNAISPDGLRIATNTANGQPGIAVRDIRASDWTRIVPGEQGNMPQFPLFSPDGRLIAFRLLTVPGVPTAGIGVVEATAGATPRTVLAPYARGKNPIAWSPDGRQLLLYRPSLPADSTSQTEASGAELDWVDVASGVVRNARRFEFWRRVGNSGLGGIRGVSLSPDGSTIAFSAAAREGASEEHIFVMDADGGNERAAVQLAGINRQPRWTPDGGHLLFVSERSGQRALMAVRMQAGRAAGEPQVVQPNFTGHLVDMTRTGDLHYMNQASGGFSMFVAERGSANPRITQTFRGQSGTWSRGGRLAFVRSRPGGEQDLIIRNMSTGEERLYAHPGITVVSPRWFNDDSAVIVHVDAQGSVQSGGAFYRVDVASGVFTHLLDLNRNGRFLSSVTALSPDNSTLYAVVRDQAQGPWKALVAIEVATGAERVVLPLQGAGLPGRSAPGIAASPDGTTIAVRAWADGVVNGRIFTVRADGTAYREVVASVAGGGWPDVMRWAPDGLSLVFDEKPGTGPTSPWRTMVVSASGGAPTPDGLNSAKFDATVPLPLIEIGNVASIDLSPDGSQIVFGSRTIPTYDLWVLENVQAHLAR
jgi:Tol biopolymer transport system component